LKYWELRLRGAAATAMLVAGLAWPTVSFGSPFDTLFGSPTSLPASAATDPLVDAMTYRSHDGRLDVTLEAKVVRVKVGPFEINAATYNGVYGGPVLRVKPGDVLHVHLVNHLDQTTNIHFHGLAVSPLGHGDNAMLSVMPGKEWDYEIPIPANHNPGLYWYHTHAHGFAERQLMAGLSGLLVIEGFQDEEPGLASLKERLFALKDFQADEDGNLYRVLKAYHRDLRTINGQLMPRIDIQPGETQLWRLSNQTANTYFRLSLEGHTFRIIARDAQPVVHPATVKELMFGPSQRMDVLVDGGSPGSYMLTAERTLTGPAGDEFPAQNMGLLVVAPPSAGAPLAANLPEAPGFNTVADLSGAKIDAQRLMVFSEDGTTGLFFINHRIFDHERVDVRVPLGNTEDWTVRNSTDELHIFHIHQVHFQVMSVNGQPQPFDGMVDTVNIPIHGEVKIRIPFTDPKIVGRFMFHCHILEHEDKGMMAQVEVYDPNAASGQGQGTTDDMHGMKMDDGAATMPASNGGR
jgi:FtsP/CotA-like multicopper oxidase with cupredoxin domain